MADIEITVDAGTPKRLLTAGKYCDKNILVTASGGAATPVIEPLEVTENGTYNAPDGVDGYSPVTVNVSGGITLSGGQLYVNTNFYTVLYVIYVDGSHELFTSSDPAPIGALPKNVAVLFFEQAADRRKYPSLEGETDYLRAFGDAGGIMGVFAKIKGSCTLNTYS